MTSSKPARLPPMGAALLLRALFKRPAGQGSALQTEFLAPAPDPAHLRRYRTAFGFQGQAVPLTYHYLAVQRAHLASLLRPEFPFRIAGMVHVSNLLEELAPWRPREPYRLHTTVQLEEPTERGARYCVCVTHAWQHGAAVVRCESRYLAVRGTAGEPRIQAAPAGVPPAAQWTVAGDAGRRYATLSGDWNPIHLWPWTARLMGLAHPIIHGMHTLATACSALEAQGARVYRLQARFKAPVALESRLALYASGGAFSVASAGRVAVEGTYDVDNP